MSVSIAKPYRRGLLYPLAKKGTIIGVPYQGTHSLGNWQSDRAIDLRIPVGTPVVAVESGKVVKVRRHPQDGGRFAGDQVTIQGPAGGFFYAHLSKTTVSAGQTINAGDVIGASGSANGVPHLHFGAERDDPRKLLGITAGGGGGGIHLPSITTIASGLVPVAGPALATAGTIGDVFGGGIPNPIAAGEKAVVGAITDQLGQFGARVLVYAVLIIGGAALIIAGISRATGLDAHAGAVLKTAAKVVK